MFFGHSSPLSVLFEVTELFAAVGERLAAGDVDGAAALLPPEEVRAPGTRGNFGSTTKPEVVHRVRSSSAP